MGLIYSSLSEIIFPSNPGVSIWMTGLDGAGKTSILRKLRFGKWHPTPGDQLNIFEFQQRRLQIREVGEAKWKHWYSYDLHADCLIFVIDSADRLRSQEAAEALSEFLSHEELKGKALLIYANKQDLLHAMTMGEITQELGLLEIHDRRWNLQSCDMARGQGLIEGLEWLIAISNE